MPILPPMVLTPEQLYKSAQRMRLTRAGLVKIMQENEARDAVKDADADAVIAKYAIDKSDAVR